MKRATRVVVLAAGTVAIVVATAVWWARFGTRTDVVPPIVAPAPSPTVDYFDPGVPRALVAYGTVIGQGGTSSVIDPISGVYREVPGQIHTISPDLRWAVYSVERPGLPQRFTYWLYDTIAGHAAGSLGVHPFAHVRWSADGHRLAFVEIESTSKQDHCATVARFIDVATGRVRETSLDCEFGRDYALGWTQDGRILLRDNADTLVAVNDDGQVSEADADAPYFGPGLAGRSPTDPDIQRRVAAGEDVFLAPASALWPDAANQAVIVRSVTPR